MKWIIFGVLALLFGGALFLPEAGSQQIRNLPLLIGIVCTVIALYLFGILRYVFFMIKTKKALEKKGMRVRKTVISPFSSKLRGRYAMSFGDKNSDINITFMVARHPRYFFQSVNSLEFYKRGGLMFPAGRNNSPHVMAGEIRLVGKQKLVWDDLDKPNTVHVLLFNKFPPKITDSEKRGELGNGDVICGSTVRLMDWSGFCRYLDSDEER